MNQELENIYNSAKTALSDDLRQNYYRAAQSRNQAFRRINNMANARHSMFSGAPNASQMQYDQNTFLPGVNRLAMQAIQKQKENQEAWDKHMNYMKGLNAQNDYYNSLFNNPSGATESGAPMGPQAGNSMSGGSPSIPTFSAAANKANPSKSMTKSEIAARYPGLSKQPSSIPGPYRPSTPSKSNNTGSVSRKPALGPKPGTSAIDAFSLKK